MGFPSTLKFIDTEGRTVVTRDVEKLGNGVLLFIKQDRVLVWEGEKIPEIDAGAGYTEVYMDLMPLSCTLQDGSSGKFHVMHILSQCIF